MGLGGDGIDLIYFDPEYVGHHIGHLRIVAERAAVDARLRRVHFLLGQETEDAAVASVLAAIRAEPKFTVEHVRPDVAEALGPRTRQNSRQRGVVRWRETRRVLKGRPGWIFYHNLIDDALFGAALDRTPVPGLVTGCVHFSAPAARGAPALRRWKLRAKYALARRPDIPTVFTLDHLLLAHGPSWLASTWRHLPDPLPLDAAQTARLFALRPPPRDGALTLLLFGSIGLRKGVLPLLEAMALLPPTLRRAVRLRLLGRFSEGAPGDENRLAAAIAQARAQGAAIDVDDRFVTEDEIISALGEAHVVMAAYRHHEGTSSVLIWAAAAGRPVIAQNSGWIGAVTVAEGLGAVCDPLDPRAIAAAIEAAAASPAHDVERPRAFARRYTADAFYETLVSGLLASRARAPLRRPGGGLR